MRTGPEKAAAVFNFDKDAYRPMAKEDRATTERAPGAGWEVVE